MARGGFWLIWSRISEFNILQLILTDLARNIGECKDHAPGNDLAPAIDLVTSPFHTRDQPVQEVEDVEEVEERIFMVSRLFTFLTPPSVSADLLDVRVGCLYDAVQYWIRGTGCQPFGRTCPEHHPRPDRYPERRATRRFRFIFGSGR